MTDKHIYVFGEFQLDAQQKILLRDGERISLHPKTFATLLVLVEHSGTVITKDELLEKVWPDTFVEESSLTKNIALARKALRNGHDHSDYIETIPTVGYRFVPPVSAVTVMDVEPFATTVLPMVEADTAISFSSAATLDKSIVVPPSPFRLQRWQLMMGGAGMVLLGLIVWLWIRQSPSHHVPTAAAYRLYVEGRERWNKRTSDDLLAARDLFLQAITLDGQYAEAHAGLADCYALLNVYGTLPAKDVYPKALAEAQYALQLDETLVEPYTTLGFIYYRYLWDWKAAEASFQKALALDPNSEIARHWYGEFLVASGRFDEGLMNLRAAEKGNPFSLIIKTDIGWGLFLARRYEEAAAQFSQTLQMDERYEMAHYCLGDLHMQQKNFSAAMIAMQNCPSLTGNSPAEQAQIQATYARAGFAAAIRQWLALVITRREQKQRYVSPVELARYYVFLGEKDEAFKWLEQALSEHNADLAFLKVNPNFDPLREDARFAELLHRLKFQNNEWRKGERGDD